MDSRQVHSSRTTVSICTVGHTLKVECLLQASAMGIDITFCKEQELAAPYMQQQSSRLLMI